MNQDLAETIVPDDENMPSRVEGRPRGRITFIKTHLAELPNDHPARRIGAVALHDMLQAKEARGGRYVMHTHAGNAADLQYDRPFGEVMAESIVGYRLRPDVRETVESHLQRYREDIKELTMNIAFTRSVQIPMLEMSLEGTVLDWSPLPAELGRIRDQCAVILRSLKENGPEYTLKACEVDRIEHDKEIKEAYTKSLAIYMVERGWFEPAYIHEQESGTRTP